MSSGLDFNPREVLDHLHELGYTNITADQLKEFIKDLKKLIKYDQRVAEGKIKAGDPRYQNDDEDSDDSDENFDEDDGNHLRPPHTRHVVSPLTSEMAKSNMRRKPNIDLRLDRNDFTNSQGTSQGSSDVTDSKQYQKILRPKSESIDGHKPKKSSARPSSAKENILPTRSSSFIRPWKYQSHGPQPGVRSNRCDPVALYHKYQQLWQQNKIPGEDTHSGLRWNIREKMLGQDPHPRPVSQASSVETMTRRRVTSSSYPKNSLKGDQLTGVLL